MTIFEKEADMQDWLSSELENIDGIADLIINCDDIDKFLATTPEEVKYKKSFDSCLTALYINEVISIDENISLKQGDILKPDFTLYAPEQEGVIIVELKNEHGASRQAGTELSAYACELKSHMPFLSDGDLYNVIISSVWRPLIKHYIFHEIYWNNRNIICLEPVVICGETKLKIVDIKSFLEVDTPQKISIQHMAGMHICLYSKEYKTNSETGDDFNCYLPQMTAALSVMASVGRKQSSHGFVFLWKDKLQKSLSPYLYTIVNLSPFLSLERHLHGNINLNQLPKTTEKLIELSRKFTPTGHGRALFEPVETGRQFLDKICSLNYEGLLGWSALKDTMLSRGDLIAFQGWGTFEENFNAQLIQKYQAGDITQDSLCPQLGLKVISDLVDPNYEYIHLF